MVETESERSRGGFSSRWIIPGVFVLVVVGGGYALLYGPGAGPIDRAVQPELPSALADNEFQVASIPVEGMTCAACAARVKRTLQGLDGVIRAEVSLTERNVKVEYIDKKLSSQNIVAAINALGYKARAPQTAEQRTQSTNKSRAVGSPVEEGQ